jgi:gustatory receptor
MIEIPMTDLLAKDFKNVMKLQTSAKDVLPIKAHEVIDQIYDIVEILQEICSKLNSFFGKKVKGVLDYLSTNKSSPQVIFTVLTAFICLTVQLFYIINHIRHSFQSNKSIISAAASCSLIFTHILELWVIFISGHRVKDMWSMLIKRVQNSKRKFASNERFKAQIDELVSIMVFTRIEIKAAGLFNIDLSVITSVSVDCHLPFRFTILAFIHHRLSRRLRHI